MEVLQQRLDLAEQERDQATTDQAIAQAAAAQAVQELLIAQKQAAPGGGGQVSFALSPHSLRLRYSTTRLVRVLRSTEKPQHH